MLIDIIECKKCKDIIYSRCRHDMRWCSCGSCAIDGGFDYLKVTGNFEDFNHKTINLFKNKTNNEIKTILFNDWNSGENKYGLIKGGVNDDN